MPAQKKQRGFTLIEILVVIVIIGFLSALLVVYNRGSQKQIALFREQAKLVSNLQRAKSLAIQTFKAGDPVCGYGVHFNPISNEYIIFRDLKDINGTCISSNKEYDAPSGTTECVQECFERFSLVDTGIFLSSDTSETMISDVFFTPPDPLVKLTWFVSEQPEATITLKASDSDLSSVVIINKAGQISGQ